MKVALIHDHLAQDGGAEKVLKAISDLFPEAPIFTLLYEKKNADKYFKDRKIYTSVIQRLPGGVKHYKWYMPFMPVAVEFFDLTAYDLIISDASAFAKGVITPENSLHICYCHTPTRYLWSDTHQYLEELKYNKYLKKIIAFFFNYIRIWDKAAADRVDKYIANSYFIKKRIKKYYRRDSTVIYPPVDIDKFYITKKEDNNEEPYFLIGGRLAPYKRFDLVIESFKILGLKLKIYGSGIDMERLKEIAGNGDIEFLGRVSDEKRAELYSKCQAFVNPQEEDFGITAVEAMSSGRPVIAYKSGGAKEQVTEKTGIFFDNQTVDDLVQAVKAFDINNFNSEEIREYANKFSVDKFKNQLMEYIKEEYNKFKD